jgi:hypothetical protein
MCYFGEIAGKHSEVYGDIEESEVCIDTQTEKVIEFLELHPSGHDYNHSFLCTLTDRYSDQGYEKGDEGYDENLVMLASCFMVKNKIIFAPSPNVVYNTSINVKVNDPIWG